MQSSAARIVSSNTAPWQRPFSPIVKTWPSFAGIFTKDLNLNYITGWDRNGSPKPLTFSQLVLTDHLPYGEYTYLTLVSGMFIDGLFPTDSLCYDM